MNALVRVLGYVPCIVLFGFRFANAPPIVVDAAVRGPTISQDVRGANMAVWFDVTQPGIANEFTGSALHLVRWPGGSDSDAYHWQTHSLCGGGYDNPNSTFDNFVADVVRPAHLDVAVTVNYGSNAACNGGGDPNEAAAWVDHANNQQHDAIERWTVGNEVYGSWEYDLHAKPHDAATYAQAVASGYYPAIKAKDPNARVGVVVEPGWNPPWDPIVLTQAKYDFVEYHYYAQSPGQEGDAYLLQKAPQALSAAVAALQAEMKQYDVPTSVPIYLGEIGSVYSNPGKQTSSITQALFAGMVIGELAKSGVPMATWWLGNGGCSDASSGNFSPTLYGWQNFGGYMIFSDGIPEYGCPNATPVPLGTPLPTARAYQVAVAYAQDGERTLATTVPHPLSLVRAYGATQGSGYTVMLFNLQSEKSIAVTVQVAHAKKSSYSATEMFYDRHIYDASKNNVWLPVVTKSLGTVQPTFNLTLAPWSMTVVVLR
ncbi:MAG: hypothetical protein ABI346_03790 [Candidatus Baltobacteraceae bacterium]